MIGILGTTSYSFVSRARSFQTAAVNQSGGYPEPRGGERQREERGPKPCRSAARRSTRIMFALTKTVPRFETLSS